MKKSTKREVNTAVVSPPAGQSGPQLQVQVPLLYADAVGNLLMGPITSRVTLVLNVGPAKDGVQPTAPTMELVIPTPALLAFGNQLRQLVRNRGSEFLKAFEVAAKQVADLTLDK
jgi:hypothetical protein